jgi:serine/threonine protein phosphatase 1
VIDQVGFVGDIHGEVELLERLLDKAIPRVSRFVFLGDYVNRGRRSREVIDRLVKLHAERVPATFLAGNHDRAFLRALSSSDIVPFLRIGGAATISSYLHEPITDLAQQLRQAVPAKHWDFLDALVATATGRGT